MPNDLSILVSCDDGWQANGYRSLIGRLERSGYNLFAAATKRGWPSFGTATGLNMPDDRADLVPSSSYVSRTPVGIFDATPSVVARQLVDAHPDADGFLSGVNYGPNVGPDLIHSGTFCQALAANWFGLPALAISLDDVYSVNESQPGSLKFDAAASAAVAAWRILRRTGSPFLANLNFPNSAQSNTVQFASASPHEYAGTHEKLLLRKGIAPVTVFAPRSLTWLDAVSDRVASELNATFSEQSE